MPLRSALPVRLARLQDQLDAITARTRTLVQPERLAISEQATADLIRTGIEDRMLQPGSLAPAFALTDAVTGKLVRSTDLLALGPLVINFFRGRWCPYCVTELEAWRDLYAHLRRPGSGGQNGSPGALFVAISPQTARQNAFTADQLKQQGTASATPIFPILSDPGASVAEQFGLAHTVPQKARSYFRSILVNIPFANSGLTYDTAPDSAWRLPMPATFVIRQDSTVAFAEAHADFRVRPEPADILAAIATL